MSLCPQCGLELVTGEFCSHHLIVTDGWAASNRLMCDFFHRGKIPPRVKEDETEYTSYGYVDS